MADAAIVQNSYMQEVNSSMAHTESLKTIQFQDFRGDANANRKADYYLNMFNIAPRRFLIRRPPHFPQIQIAACPEDKPFFKVATIPNIVNEKWVDADSGEIRIRGIAGERFATDMLNPSNLGIDIWTEVSQDELNWIDHGSDDLTRRGLFWTTNETPSAEELAKATAKLEKHYKHLIQEADELASDPKTRKEIGKEHHLAAEYFHVTSAWHIVAAVQQSCPNCGELVKSLKIAYHVNSLGRVCVLDWKRAIAAGAVKKSDMPEDLK